MTSLFNLHLPLLGTPKDYPSTLFENDPLYNTQVVTAGLGALRHTQGLSVVLPLPGRMDDYPIYLFNPTDPHRNARLLMRGLKAEEDEMTTLAQINLPDVKEDIVSTTRAGDLGVNGVKKIIEGADRPSRPVMVKKTANVPHSGDLIVTMENVTILVEVTTSATFVKGHQDKLMRDVVEYDADAAIYIYTRNVKRPAFAEMTAGGGQPCILITDALNHTELILVALERLVAYTIASRAASSKVVELEMKETREKIQRLQSLAQVSTRCSKELLRTLNAHINSACDIFDSLNSILTEHDFPRVPTLRPAKRAKISDRM